MKDIKTRENKNDIKMLDRAAGLAKVTKDATVRTKDQIQNLSGDGQITPDKYAKDKIKYMAESAISDINTEYEAKINEKRGTVAYDVLEMSGSRAVWPEVLSVYAVKTAGDPNNPQEVASMDESKKQILKDVFWTMNEITHSTSIKTENDVTEIDSVNGNIVETAESEGRAYLYIKVIHKSVDEMASHHGFTDSQKQQLRELLSEENKRMWSDVLYDNTA